MTITKRVRPKRSRKFTSDRSRKLRTMTKIALVVDKSGSMDAVRKQAFHGINEQLQTIKKNADKEGLTEVLYIEFNDNVDVKFLKDAKSLSSIEWVDYYPSGLTSLYDAVWTAITKLDNGRKDEETAYLVIVISDGMENASKMMTSTTLAHKITELQNSGQWTFTYMMSNIDLSEFKNTFDVFGGNITYWVNTPTETKHAFNYCSDSTAAYLLQRNANKGCTYTSSNFYSDANTTSGTTLKTNAMTPS
jgi:Mg-chelatase subunit ChlD